MSSPVDLSAIVNATQRAKNHVLETKGVKHVDRLDAVLGLHDVQGDCVGFLFQDDCVTMYTSKGGKFTSASIKSPEIEGCSADTGYTAEQAVRGLLSHLGVTIFMRTKACVRERTAWELKPLTLIADKETVEGASHFSDVTDLFKLVRKKYATLSWLMPERCEE